MSPVEVTLREWWELDRDSWKATGCDPVSYWTVVQTRKMYRDFPEASRVVAPNTHLYPLRDLRKWKKGYPDLFKGLHSQSRLAQR